MTMQVEQRIIGDPFDKKRSIVEPNDNDILCGRGGLSNHHPGNERYRSLIRTARPFYQLCPKFTKLYVSKAIVQIVNDQGGRFLERSPKDGFWCIVPNKKAVHKTSQALRERDDEQASLMIPRALLEKLEKLNEKQVPPKLKEMIHKSAGAQASSPSLDRVNEEGCAPVRATSTADKTMEKEIPSLPNDAVFSNYVQLPQQSSQQPPSVPAPLEASLISPLAKNLPKYYLPQNNLMGVWTYDKESQMPDTIITSVFSPFLLQPTNALQYMPFICSPPSPPIKMTKREIAFELCRLYYSS